MLLARLTGGFQTKGVVKWPVSLSESAKLRLGN